ncbi:hypothetical protein A7D01_10190 [Xanthomonas arboricola]|nr:hypothetical protein A7D01_10190 [Xanthomonas arboricola]
MYLATAIFVAPPIAAAAWAALILLCALDTAARTASRTKFFGIVVINEAPVSVLDQSSVQVQDSSPDHKG